MGKDCLKPHFKRILSSINLFFQNNTHRFSEKLLKFRQGKPKNLSRSHYLRQDVDSRTLTRLKNDVITKYFQFHFRRVSQMQISPPWCCCHYHNSSSYQTLIRGTISLSEIFNSRFFVFVRNKGKGATTFKTSAGFYLVTEQ